MLTSDSNVVAKQNWIRIVLLLWNEWESNVEKAKRQRERITAMGNGQRGRRRRFGVSGEISLGRPLVVSGPI